MTSAAWARPSALPSETVTCPLSHNDLAGQAIVIESIYLKDPSLGAFVREALEAGARVIDAPYTASQPLDILTQRAVTLIPTRYSREFAPPLRGLPASAEPARFGVALSTSASLGCRVLLEAGHMLFEDSSPRQEA